MIVELINKQTLESQEKDFKNIMRKRVTLVANEYAE